MASTASGRHGVAAASAAASAVNPPKARARAGMLRLSVGNGCDPRDAPPRASSSVRTSRPRHSGSTRWCSVPRQRRDDVEPVARGRRGSCAIWVMTSPVGATSGAKCGHRTSRCITSRARSHASTSRPADAAGAHARTRSRPRATSSSRRSSIDRAGALDPAATSPVVDGTSSPARADDGGQGGGVGGDDRAPPRHRLEHRQARPPRTRREGARHRATVETVEVRLGQPARPADAVGDAERARPAPAPRCSSGPAPPVRTSSVSGRSASARTRVAWSLWA